MTRKSTKTSLLFSRRERRGTRQHVTSVEKQKEPRQEELSSQRKKRRLITDLNRGFKRSDGATQARIENVVKAKTGGEAFFIQMAFIYDASRLGEGHRTQKGNF